MNAFDLLLQYEFLQRAVLAGVLVAVLCGLVGVFLVLRGLSLLGDGLAHMSFGGVALGLVAGLYPLGTAILFSVGGALAVHFLRERGIVKGDTAIGILFTTGLAFGILLISATQGFNVNTHSYLFGSILAIETSDLVVTSVVAAVLLVLLLLFYKELFYMTYSEEAARVSGLPVGLLNVLFVSLTACAIVAAARIVGILLVSALIVVPAATSLQVARSFRVALVLSVLVGVASVVVGMLLSIQQGYATGASVALTCVAFFVVALGAKTVLRRVRAS